MDSIDLEADYLRRQNFEAQITEASSSVLRILSQISGAVENDLSNRKTLSDDLHSTTARLLALTKAVIGRVERIPFITAYDRREDESTAPILTHLQKLQGTLNTHLSPLRQRSTFSDSASALISHLDQWRWDVESLWIPPMTSNKNVLIPEFNVPLNIPSGALSSKSVEANPSSLERLVLQSGLPISHNYTVANFAAWSSYQQSPLQVQSVHLVEGIKGSDSALLFATSEPTPSWILAQRPANSTAANVSFAISKDSILGPAREVSSFNPSALTIAQVASHLRIIDSTSAFQGSSPQQSRWFSRRVFIGIENTLQEEAKTAASVKLLEDDGNTDSWLKVLSIVRLSEAYLDHYQSKDALTLCDEAVDTISSLPYSTPYHHSIKAYIHSLRHHILSSLHVESVEASKASREAYDILSGVSTPDRAQIPNFDGRLARYMDNLAISLSEIDEDDGGEDPERFLEESLELGRKVIELRRQLVKADRAIHLPHLAYSLANQAASLADSGNVSSALTHAREALSIRRSLYAKQPDLYRGDLAFSLASIAGILFSSEGAGEGETDVLGISKECIALHREMFALRPDVCQDDLAERLYHHALYAAEMNDWDEACSAGAEAVDHRRALYGRQPDLMHRFGLAQFLTNWAGDLLSAERPEEAAVAGAEALELFRALYKEDEDAYRGDLAWALKNMAAYLGALGQRKEAEAFLKESKELGADDEDDEWEDEDEEDDHDHDHDHSHAGHHHH